MVYERTSSNWTIEPATPDNATTILELQRLAYQSEASLYNDYNIAPLTQTLAEMLTDFGREIILKAVAGDRIVGSVRGHLNGESC